MINMSYNGVDISGDVSVNRCWHDMYAGGRIDSVLIRMNDVRHLWDSWGPSPGDEIEVSFDTIRTGTMFLREASPRNGIYEIRAESAPASIHVKRRKSWQRVWLSQIGREISDRNGLTFESYGVTDQIYSYIPQEDMSDFEFLTALAQAESCAFQIFDKQLILFSEPFLEDREPSETLTIGSDGDYRYAVAGDLYGSCVLDGQYSGAFAVENGSALVLRPDTFLRASSDADANRFARGFLRAANKHYRSGYVRNPTILSGYAAGSVLDLRTERAASWDGKVFLHHIRNDYVKRSGKLFFRKPLEGY